MRDGRRDVSAATIDVAAKAAALFRTTNPTPNVAPNWNTAPSQNKLVVRRHSETGE